MGGLRCAIYALHGAGLVAETNVDSSAYCWHFKNSICVASKRVATVELRSRCLDLRFLAYHAVVYIIVFLEHVLRTSNELRLHRAYFL